MTSDGHQALLAVRVLGPAEQPEHAAGRTVEVNVYLARVIWHGRERAVQVLATEGGPLVGMALLRGSRLTVEAAPDGPVLVEELP